MTGHIRKGSDIDLHLFSDSAEAVTNMLEFEGYEFELERKQVVKHGETRLFTHIHVRDQFDFELTIYAEDRAHYVFKSSITGKAIERASIRELEELIAREYPDVDLDEEIVKRDETADPHQMYRLLLAPLENVKQCAKYHPEGDALYHSLQVFELARDTRPYDEEFLLAALLHDVGKAIDPGDHVGAALDALDGLITDRTRYFIAYHMDALALKAGTLPAKQRKRLEASPDFDDLMLLRDLDTAGRVPGAQVGTVDQALDILRELAKDNG